jgi:hypothetical protein
MTTSHTLGIAVDQTFATGRTAPFSDRLWGLLSALLRAETSTGLHPVSGYYKDASDRACASAPVTSLRQIAGGRR